MAQRVDGGGESYREVGLAWWEYDRARCLKWIEDGDPRFHPDWTRDWTDVQREAAQEQHHSVRPTHRRRLEAMDRRGWFEAMLPPPVPCDHGSALWPGLGESRRAVRVWSHGRIERV